jgi:outer membrane protein assembly factor BamA
MTDMDHESGGVPVRSPEIATIGKSEADKAREFKERAAEIMKGFCALKDEAAREGFLIAWVSIQPNAFGKNEVIDLHVLKRF